MVVHRPSYWRPYSKVAGSGLLYTRAIPQRHKGIRKHLFPTPAALTAGLGLLANKGLSPEHAVTSRLNCVKLYMIVAMQQCQAGVVNC